MARQGMRPADIRIEEQRATTARGTRSPEYNFGAINMPEYRLIPTAFCPVLAGDTVAAGTTQARIIGQALAAATVQGAWCEAWTFYVRIMDFAAADDVAEILIDPNSAAVVDWRTEAMKAIWKVYFQDEGENLAWSWTNFLRNPRVGWWDSSRDAADLPDVSGATDEWDEQWIRYQAMRRAKLTTKTYEEYLAAQGVNLPVQLRTDIDPEQKVPELLSYTREFVYPQMSMSPTSGGDIVPQSTFQWMINSNLKRSRFCAEPGFVVTCLAIRPKKYVMGYTSAGSTVSGASFDPLTVFNDAQGWQPIDLDTDPHTALAAIPGGYFGDTVPGAEQIIDTRDILLNGQDEWLDGTNRNLVASAAVPFTRINPPTGSRPTAAVLTYSVDARYKYRIKSRVNKDTTR